MRGSVHYVFSHSEARRWVLDGGGGVTCQALGMSMLNHHMFASARDCESTAFISLQDKCCTLHAKNPEKSPLFRINSH